MVLELKEILQASKTEREATTHLSDVDSSQDSGKDHLKHLLSANATVSDDTPTTTTAPQIHEFIKQHPELLEELMALATSTDPDAPLASLDDAVQEKLKILLAGTDPNTPSPVSISSEITPISGFVIKTRSLQEDNANVPKGCKVFINLCQSPYIPSPPLCSDEEIRKALQSNDNSMYRVPMSLAGPRTDSDKSGSTCVVFDACIHENPMEKSIEDIDFKYFLITLALEWVEAKHNLSLSREFTLPKLKSKGTLMVHHIKRPKNMIASMKADKKVKPSRKSDEKSIPKSAPLSLAIPSYTLIVEPPDDGLCPPEYFVIEVDLPLLQSVQSLPSKSPACTVDIEASLLLLHCKGLYDLRVPLPVPIDVSEGGAQFDRDSRKLTVTLTCLPPPSPLSDSPLTEIASEPAAD